MSTLFLYILFAEDEPQFRYLIQRYAARSGFQLLNTSKASEIITLAKQWHPKAVILDIDTPELDTTQVLGQLRADAVTRHIPIVLCSSYESVLLRWGLEVDGSWLKPVLYDDFANTLAAIGI
ncbi:MAG: putative two-component hybrid sensor and regulator [Chloroflexi bacterium]|jgi:CheY-like chemotaxis protein|nr:putative two-component hybrid sensor and regulator [Chloroflexota bacterium]